MSESFTINEKVAIFDRLYSYLMDPISHDDPLVERELEKTKAENDKLREQGERLFDKTLELGTENAKLRELVTELTHTIVKCQNGKCNDCQFGNPTGFGCRWDAHMRELGIEVESHVND